MGWSVSLLPTQSPAGSTTARVENGQTRWWLPLVSWADGVLHLWVACMCAEWLPTCTGAQKDSSVQYQGPFCTALRNTWGPIHTVTFVKLVPFLRHFHRQERAEVHVHATIPRWHKGKHPELGSVRREITCWHQAEDSDAWCEQVISQLAPPDERVFSFYTVLLMLL